MGIGCKIGLSNKKEVKKLCKEKNCLALDKHTKALKGTDFVKCAVCPGTSGRVEADNKMLCSRVGAVPVLLTSEQARSCDGTKPIIAARSEHKAHSCFLRPVRKLVENQANVSV